MLIMTFTDEELRRISEESPVFSDKLAAMAARAQSGKPGPGLLLQAPALTEDQDVKDYFATIYPKNGLARCMSLIRAWAKERNIQRYSTAAGAQRLVMALKNQVSTK
jgi:hypothetical protein